MRVTDSDESNFCGLSADDSGRCSVMLLLWLISACVDEDTVLPLLFTHKISVGGPREDSIDR